MKTTNNIFRMWWFNFIFLPLLSLCINITIHFLPNSSNWSDSDESLLLWLIVICFAIIVETIILSIRKVQYRSNHYLYILFSSNLSLFISFIFNRFDLIKIESLEDSSIWWWVNSLLQMLFQVALLFVVKFIVWQFLSIRQISKKNKDNQFQEALDKVKKLEEENSELKKLLNPDLQEQNEQKPTSLFKSLRKRFSGKKDQ